MANIRLLILVGAIGIGLCDDITLFEHPNYAGESKRISYNRCFNLLDENEFNDRTSSIKSPSNQCVKLWEHSCCQGKSIEFKGDIPNLANLGFDDAATSLSPCGNYYIKSPATLKEKWLGHSQGLRKVAENRDISVYYNEGMDASITWPQKFLTRVWQYVKKSYGSFGPDGGRLYPIFHGDVEGSPYDFNSIQNYFDVASDCRNMIDVVSRTRDGWSSDSGVNLDVITHEVSHIVEGASKGVHGSPSYGLWGDSKWAEIFNYDVYKGLGMKNEMDRWYNQMLTSRDDFPKPNTYWFRDWFYPIYSKYGGVDLLNKYLGLLAKYFPRHENGFQYKGDTINMGEFVHFFSGAARTSLKPQADKAFKWDNNYEDQFQAAKRKFPQIKYRESRN